MTPLSNVEGAVVLDLPPGLPSALLTQRPDIRGAENRLRASEQEIGAARAAFFPSISLIGDGGIASTALNKLFIGNATLWAFGSGLTGTIFDGGRLRGELNEAEANRQIAIADYERTVQTAFRDVSGALAARRWLTSQIVTERRTLDGALCDREQVATMRDNQGSAAYLEVLEEQCDLFAALGRGGDDPSRAIATTMTKAEEPLP